MNKSKSSTKHIVLTSLVLVFIVGCGGPYDAYVTGVIKLDGNPLPRGTVTFNPSDQGAQAYGLINADGSYTIQTGREEGINAGSYKVTVVAREEPTLEGKDGGPPPMGKSITPEWYRSPRTSGLAYEIESGSHEINIDLSTEPPADWKPKRSRKR